MIEEVEIVSLPIFSAPIMVTVGEISLNKSGLSSTSAYICSSDTLREEPRPKICTVRESVPMSAKLSSM